MPIVFGGNIAVAEQPPTAAHLVQTRRLSKVYDSGTAPKQALRDVELSVDEGELITYG